MPIYALGELVPHIDASAFVHPDAVIIGSVRIGPQSSVWPGAVLRADYGTITIGAQTSIQDGTVIHCTLEEPTVIGDRCTVGHNVHIGADTALAGCAGVAGSARIGAHCTVGGGAVVLGHLEIVDGVHISAASVVMRSISKAGQYSGIFPIDENASWEKNAATLRQLHSLRDRIKSLESALESQKK